MRKDLAELWQLTETCVGDAGFELIELQYGREPDGFVLRVFIDSPPDGVGFSECERVSRDLSAALDVADLVRQQYRLEVSSPGIERPLRRAKDFARFSGQQAKIKTVDPIDGRRNFTGTLRGAQNDAVEIDCEGKAYRVPVAAIARAHLIPDWDAEFRRAGRNASVHDHHGPHAESGTPGTLGDIENLVNIGRSAS